MELSELVDLIRSGVDPAEGKSWAELGAGTGNFTSALAELLGDRAHIVAVDRDRGSLRQLEQRLRGRPGLTLETMVADFRQPFDLNELDGVLMANSLHFVRDKQPVLAAVRAMLKPGGKLLMVEYDADRGNPWVPHPFSFATWQKLAAAAGFEETRLLATRPSRHLNAMYAAVSRRPREVPYPD